MSPRVLSQANIQSLLRIHQTPVKDFAPCKIFQAQHWSRRLQAWRHRRRPATGGEETPPKRRRGEAGEALGHYATCSHRRVTSSTTDCHRRLTLHEQQLQIGDVNNAAVDDWVLLLLRQLLKWRRSGRPGLDEGVWAVME
eukprot:GHVT01075960.1.p1 GENE.GHVT01075960.1~~GHVT01075960.1.p1  ORF type:complete len:140 (-),score=19.96 GHVT01075960.1:1127-1546(-)